MPGLGLVQVAPCGAVGDRPRRVDLVQEIGIESDELAPRCRLPAGERRRRRRRRSCPWSCPRDSRRRCTSGVGDGDGQACIGRYEVATRRERDSDQSRPHARQHQVVPPPAARCGYRMSIGASWVEQWGHVRSVSGSFISSTSDSMPLSISVGQNRRKLNHRGDCHRCAAPRGRPEGDPTPAGPGVGVEFIEKVLKVRTSRADSELPGHGGRDSAPSIHRTRPCPRTRPRGDSSSWAHRSPGRRRAARDHTGRRSGGVVPGSGLSTDSVSSPRRPPRPGSGGRVVGEPKPTRRRGRRPAMPRW